MSTNPAESFKTHSNYIRAFGLLVYEPVPLRRGKMYEVLSHRIHEAGVLTNNRRDGADLDQVKSSMHTAWGTETLLQSTERFANEEEILRLSNNWSTVQTYYVLYHCAQAFHCARGHRRLESHPRTQNVFFDQWASRQLDLLPWSLAYGYGGVMNTPAGRAIDTAIHPWSNCVGDNVLSLAAKSLMTTRREAVTESRAKFRERKLQQRKQQWRAKEEVRLRAGRIVRKEPDFALPILTAEERKAVDHDMQPFTLVNYLYRLRLKTNYEDSNMFTDGPDDERESRYVRNALCRIASGTLFLYELVVRSYIGGDIFDSWVEEWISRNLPKEHEGGLIARRPLHNI